MNEIKRAAIIDMGSNAIRLYIGEIDDANQIKEIVYKRSALRLADDSFSSGLISNKTINAVKKLFSEYKEIALSHECNQIKAVATSALRDAKNANDLIREVFLETEIMIELITGEFEAELVAKSVLNKIDENSFILVDLGGGSLEIVLVRDKSIVEKRSFQIGNLRFGKQLDPSDANQKKEIHLNKLFFSFREIIESYVDEFKGLKLIITGGNSNFIARKISNDLKLDRVFSCSREMLLIYYNNILNMSEEAFKKSVGIRKDRVQTLLPSLFIFSEISKLTSSESLIVPFTGLREGLVYHIFEMVNNAKNSLG